jgi:hypothetical protein
VVEGMFRIHGTDHPLQLHINLHTGAGAMTAKTHFMVAVDHGNGTAISEILEFFAWNRCP